MGSFSEDVMSDDEFDALCDELNVPLRPERRNPPHFPQMGTGIDLPITIGRPR
jgi:hypothetical protein